MTQYYNYNGRMYVMDGKAVVGQLAIYVSDKKAFVFTPTYRELKFNTALKKAKEIFKEDLTDQHFCEQTLEERFELRKIELEKMGFVQYNGADFSLKGIWSCYWEQVFYKSDQDWLQYLCAIEETVNEHYAKKEDTVNA
jgi:hypothetical protein